MDERVIKRLTDALYAKNADFRLLVLPDHPTPIRMRTHTAANVPYLLFDSTDIKENTWNYNEKEAAAGGVLVEKGHTLIDKLFEK